MQCQLGCGGMGSFAQMSPTFDERQCHMQFQVGFDTPCAEFVDSSPTTGFRRLTRSRVGYLNLLVALMTGERKERMIRLSCGVSKPGSARSCFNSFPETLNVGRSAHPFFFRMECRRLPTNLEHMLTFIYLSYSMMAQQYGPALA